MADQELSQEQLDDFVDSKSFGVLLVVAAIVGLVVSVASWAFLEFTTQLQRWVFVDAPSALGFSSPPTWWPVPILFLAGLIVAFAIARLPGKGGHVPALGLASGTPQVKDLPGVLLAAVATIGLGLVLGPEAPLLALGGGLALLTLRLSRREVPPQVPVLMAAVGAFAAMTSLFGTPVVAAILIIEVSAIGGPRLRLVLLPGLLGAGVGMLVTLGFGSWQGLSASAYSISALSLPDFPRPGPADFAWGIVVAFVIAVGGQLLLHGGRRTARIAAPRPFIVLPIAGVAVAALAIMFDQVTGKGINQVLFDGQAQLPALVSGADTWTIGALALLLLAKGLAYMISLGTFRGGPTFPALYLGATIGLMASLLPGFSLTAAVAVAIGAATVTILRLPWTAVVLASVLTAGSGAGTVPLVVVAVAVAYITAVAVGRRLDAHTGDPEQTPDTTASANRPA
ncbi:MAG: chloride channel protein [Candidatus Nanopelagicales bacterium]